MKHTGEFGEWFPQRFAPHAYQESSANEFFDPLPLEVAGKRGYRVIPEETPPPTATMILGDQLPEILRPEIVSEISSKSIACSKTAQPYNLQKRELDFYLRNKIPVPRIHWNERLQELVNRRGLFPIV